MGHNAPIDSPHVLDSGEVQVPCRFEWDVCFQFAIFAIESFKLRVPLDADKPSLCKRKSMTSRVRPRSRFEISREELDITQMEDGATPSQETLAHLATSSSPFANTLG